MEAVILRTPQRQILVASHRRRRWLTLIELKDDIKRLASAHFPTEKLISDAVVRGGYSTKRGSYHYLRITFEAQTTLPTIQRLLATLPNADYQVKYKPSSDSLVGRPVILSVPVGKEFEWARVLKKEGLIADAEVIAYPMVTSVSHTRKIETTDTRQQQQQEAFIDSIKAAALQKHSGVQEKVSVRKTPFQGTSKWALFFAITDFYMNKGATVTELSSDSDFLEVIVKNMKGVVIPTKGLWEKVQLSLFFRESGFFSSKITFIVDGQYAPGIGPLPPPNSAFHDMEPQYSQLLSQHLGSLASHIEYALTNARQKGSP